MQESQILTVRILQKSIVSENPNDPVFNDVARLVIPKFYTELAGHTAKGGLWVEEKRRALLAAGKPMKSERALADQSITAHLLNGLFPVATLIRKLRQIDTSVARYLDEKAYRLFVAGYVLHDWEKFPGVDATLGRHFDAGFKPDFVKHRELVKPILRQWMARLGLDEFLKAGGLNPEDQVDTLAYLAHNTQEKYETHRPTRGFRLTISDRVCELTSRLTRLADLLSSEVKHPADIRAENLKALLYQLSNGHYAFAFHAVSENRGVLTNVINNTLLDLYRTGGYQPLLYFPHGVVYLAAKDTRPPDDSGIPEKVIEKIRKLCARQIENRLVGLGRDGKGLKFADYYWLFFPPEDLVAKIGPKGARKISGKQSSAPKRAEGLRKVQSKVDELSGTDFNFPDDIRIDQLAEFCDLIERKIWDEFRRASSSNGTTSWDAAKELLEILKVTDLSPVFQLLRTHPAATGSAGGVPLGWYYVAAEYLKRNPGLGPEDLPALLDTVAQAMAEKITKALQGTSPVDRWVDFKKYVVSVVRVGGSSGVSAEQALKSFAAELDRYVAFKRSRSGLRPCSLCSTPFEASAQKEAGVLFQPQVYTNKHVISGTPTRFICPICSLEIMLRQILMNNTAQIGSNFEKAFYRYLYLYPTYYFTAETVSFLRSAYVNFHRTSFITDIRDHLVDWKTGAVDVSPARFQSLDTFLISDGPTDHNRVFKLDYPEDDPITFFFAAIPPGRDATDTESWVMPAFLALLFPLLFDTKVVVSESAGPLYASGAEFEETVVFDAPHDFVLRLLSVHKPGGNGARLRFRLDETPGLLSCFLAAYVIHLDANARQGREYNPNWGRLAELARNLVETPLYVFHYLNVWLRKQERIESLPTHKIRLYRALYKVIDPKEDAMNHPRRLVELYRRFYRAKRASAKANAILKPMDVAADVLLKADRDLFGEALIDMVAAAVMSLMQRVHNRQAEGRPASILIDGTWKPALAPEEERRAAREFSEYFVKEVFEGSLRGDRARLTGIQLNLLRDTCEFIYRQMEIEEPEDDLTDATSA